MAKVINLVESYVGNAGGSLVVSLLVEFFRIQGRSYLLCDLDRVQPDVWLRYHCLGSATADDLSLEDIIDRVELDNCEAIVNVPTVAFERISAQIAAAIEMGLLGEVQLRRWLVVVNRKSWETFERIVDGFEDDFQPILVHNLVDGFELSDEQYEFCQRRGIVRVPLSWIQFNDADLELIAANTTRPLFAFESELSEKGWSRLQFFSAHFFDEVIKIVKGV
ncbi:MAG: hypothetical protein HC778_02990 [Chamaesiphon sp. CSU_1_12]|nr:hypothetical protein [Chamaesiphon sp. CSU_1_12]